jgi:hypothetical protein
MRRSYSMALLKKNNIGTVGRNLMASVIVLGRGMNAVALLGHINIFEVGLRVSAERRRVLIRRRGPERVGSVDGGW